jgi:formylmethanofuran dehydrogenase subunit B
MPEPGPVTCAGCALLCDDVSLDRPGDEVRLHPQCELGARWFSDRAARPVDAPPATIAGWPADVEAALARAAELLSAARRPLLQGFDEATVEDARAAVALADRLGAIVVTDCVGGPWPGAPAVPLRGASTATLGEIRDRSGVVVVWREDPLTTHPRLLERLGFGDGSSSRGDGERTLIVVDDRHTATAKRAHVRLALPRERDLGALSSLHALQRGRASSAADAEDGLHELLHRINDVPHAALVYGPALIAGAGGQRRALALHELVRELSRGRHVVTLALAPATGTRGAQDVLAWQTGYAGNVDLAAGHPAPIISTRPIADDPEIDVSLSVQDDGGERPTAATAIVLSSSLVKDAEVWIRTATAGVSATGTAHRLDGTPLTLQAPLSDDAPTAPTAATLLTQLLEGLRA